MRNRKRSLRLALFGVLILALSLSSSLSPQVRPVLASDHTDTPILINAGRDDARITDFWSFIREGRLVMIMGINPFLPAEVRDYVFPTDVTYTFYIDRDSKVNFNDPIVNAAFGGTIDNPSGIQEDITFKVTFDKKNRPRVDIAGCSESDCQTIKADMRIFTGLRAETFIFAPFVNNNIGAIVIDVPLPDIKKDDDTLLLWTTSSVEDFAGPFQDAAGRTLYSQFDEKLGLNFLHPSQHEAVLGLNPDVMIINTKKSSGFPNGRLLTDDIVDKVAALPAPFNDARAFDLEFELAGFHATVDDIVSPSKSFPYLGSPHLE